MSTKQLGVVSKSFRGVEDAVIDSIDQQNDKAIEQGFETVELRMVKRNVKIEQRMLLEELKIGVAHANKMTDLYALIAQANAFDANANKRVGYRYVDTYEAMWQCFVDKECVIRGRIRKEQTKAVSVWPTNAKVVRLRKETCVVLAFDEKELRYHMSQGFSIEAIGVCKS